MKSLADHVLTGSFDINGASLVEASAGTGKTYSIQTLFLRLIVAHGIPVQKLLVVTFTDAATKELRERLRSILEKCRHAASGQKLPDRDPDRNRIAEVLKLAVLQTTSDGEAHAGLDDDTLRSRRIRRALLDFDQAAIFTIHGFCQRALQEFAFECSHDFDAEVISGDALLRELCTDWWRRVRYADGGDFGEGIAAEGFPDVDKLSRLMTEYLKRSGVILLPEHDEQTQDAAEQQVTAVLAKTVAHGVNHGETIKADLGGAEAGLFFRETDRSNIRTRLDRLSEVDDNPAAAYAQLQQLSKDLNPERISNPFPIPDEVRECINACAACESMMSRHGMPSRGNTWGAPDEVAVEWEETLAGARGLVARHQEALRQFSAVIAAHPRAFNKTVFSDPQAREKQIEAMLEERSVSAMRTAIKRVTTIKMKATIAWTPSSETESFLKMIDQVGVAARLLQHIVVAAGMEQISQRYDQRKREEHGMTFDDMLLRLQTALNDPDTADRLRLALRTRYRVALIDEFQDTDPVQYDIFNVLFGEAMPLFLVGDPKQAIYSFRGGDIYTYCAAKGGVHEDRRYSLDTNYRSQAPLIAAVNRIFRDREDKSLFGRKDIPYSDDLACNDLKARFVDAGRVDSQPFKIWDYRKPEDHKGKTTSGYASDAARSIYGAVAEEVVRLLCSDGTGFASRESAEGGNIKAEDVRRLRPSDIAILVRRHAEAAFLYRELRRRRIPAIRQAGDNVFDSPEAAELLYVLQAMVTADRVPAVKTALASALLPVSDEELVRLAREETVPCSAAESIGIDGFPDRIDAWIVLFKEAMNLWSRFGFTIAFNLLVRHTGMKAWLASGPGGERSMVNLTQIQDLLHRAAMEQHLGPEALLGWYRRQLAVGTRERNEAFETRLESDADAVQIMTIFKSKGLEFPVVFVPTMWTGIPGTRLAVCHVYHRNKTSEETTDSGEPGGSSHCPVYLHLDKNDDEAKKAARSERDDEDVRNLYVAATRASYRTYVVAGDSLGTRNSTLARCLPRELLDQWAEDESVAIDVVERRFEPAARTLWMPPVPPAVDSLRTAGEARVDKSRGHASFSSIAPHGAWRGGGEAYDFDADDTAGVDTTSDGEKLTVFSFPAGARTGECWHKVFETLDFGAGDDAIRNVVDEQLNLFRLDRGTEEERQAKRDVTSAMVRRVLNARIAVGNDRTIRLADIEEANKRPELAFDFSLSGSGAGKGARNAVWEALETAWGNADLEKGEMEAVFLSRLQNWEAEIPAGFMTGFIDLFFKHRDEQGDRYYILDWKSNRRDCEPASFHRPGLVEEISEHAYFLQYLLYTVAANQYLRMCLGDSYDYKEHFGGVLYVFLRGVDQNRDPDSQRGIFYTKPDPALVDSLTRALVRGRGGAE
jgi:exodeoxyribonuclease V beta subunit